MGKPERIDRKQTHHAASHARLSASSSKRWMNCPRSVALSEQCGGDTTSNYAEEGREAHLLGEYKIKQALGIPAKDPVASLQFYNEEMDSCATDYAVFIFELIDKAYRACPDPAWFLEQRVDFSAYVPDGFGTCDTVIVADGTLQIVDYKHGAGVLVEACENPQLMLYGLGALHMFDGIYNIEHVYMTIFQPRRHSVTNYELTPAELYKWAEEELKPAAELAHRGQGSFKAGDWCQFCKAKAQCRARADANMELAAYDFEEPALLGDDEIAGILGNLDALVSWAGDVKDFSLAEALKGRQYEGWKVVAGRSNRKYTDESAVAEMVKASGADPYEHKLLGITAMEKTLGKKKFVELLGGLVHKPPGKPVLVPATDKRGQLTITTAADDFATE